MESKRPLDHVQFLDVWEFEVVHEGIVNVPCFYTVLEKTRHHYSGEPVYRVRIESPGPFEMDTLIREEYIPHRTLEALLERRSK